MLGLALALAGATAFAQTTPAAAEGDTPRPHATGDAWLDRRLADIDAYATRHPDAFADELERYAGVPRAYVLGLLEQPGWGGGDAWFACFMARAAMATCRSVVRARTLAGPDATWEQVAAGFQEEDPASALHARVRLALADSYRRWAIPLQPDAAMSRALERRERSRAEADPAR